jgi:hypothetical protein
MGDAAKSGGSNAAPGSATPASPSQGPPTSSTPSNQGRKISASELWDQAQEQARKNPEPVKSAEEKLSDIEKERQDMEAERNRRGRVVEHTPAGGERVTDVAKIKVTTPFHEKVLRGLAQIDAVFKIDLRKVPERFRQLHFTDKEAPAKKVPSLEHPGEMFEVISEGDYFEPGENGPAAFNVKRDAKHPLLTIPHEFAHHIGKILGPDAEAAVFKEHQKTSTYEAIKAKGLDTAQYANKPGEVFARAFSQLVAEEMGKLKDAKGNPVDREALDHLNKLRQDQNTRHLRWSPDEFSGIRKELLKQLEEIGWTLR